MNLLSYTLQIANIIFQLLLVFLLLKNLTRRYVIILLYSLAYLFTTLLGEILLRRAGSGGIAYRSFYWPAEVGFDLLLFLTVIALIYHALEESPVRRSAGPLLAGVIAVTLILPFAVLRSKVFGTRWFEGTSQILNFGAAILNLGLWTALLVQKKRDPRLLGVSLGVGVTVTGAAISYGLLQLFAPARHFVNLFAALTHTAGVVLWCRAFAPRLRAKPDLTNLSPSSSYTSPRSVSPDVSGAG